MHQLMRDQLERALSGTADPATLTHLGECPDCNAEFELLLDQAKAGNVGAVTIGAIDDETGLPVCNFALPLELPIGGRNVYDLSELYFQTANDGDGVEVFAYED